MFSQIIGPPKLLIFFTCKNASVGVLKCITLCSLNECAWNAYCHCNDSNRPILFAHSTMQGPLAAMIRWDDIPVLNCTLKVGIQPSWLHSRVAPNDVIWKHALYRMTFVRKSSSWVPASSDASGSGTAGSGSRTTLPLAQHIPICSFWNFRAWQCWYSTDMDGKCVVCWVVLVAGITSAECCT